MIPKLFLQGHFHRLSVGRGDDGEIGGRIFRAVPLDVRLGKQFADERVQAPGGNEVILQVSAQGFAAFQRPAFG